MAYFKWDCPHTNCRAKGATFAIVDAFNSPADVWAVAVARCGLCQRLTLFNVAVAPPDRDAIVHLKGVRDPFAPDYKPHLAKAGIVAMKVVGTHPSAPELRAPPHVPENVAAAYLEGLKALDNGLYSAAAFSTRQALERAVRVFVPDGDHRLKARIKKLSGAQQLPPAMIDLAHTVRAEGNVAVHEEEWTPEEARQLADFAGLLFTYIFTLPAQVQAVAAERGATADKR